MYICPLHLGDPIGWTIYIYKYRHLSFAFGILYQTSDFLKESRNEVFLEEADGVLLARQPSNKYRHRYR